MRQNGYFRMSKVLVWFWSGLFLDWCSATGGLESESGDPERRCWPVGAGWL